MKVRTRMAPSPTGEYHIGHIRTLLYNYAFAKKYSGQFIVRIEDTDQERYVAGAEDRILDVIADYGFLWDEGPRVGGPYEPYFQSQRLDIYKKYALDLIEKSFAYYCFCSEERLSKLREDQKLQGTLSTKYDRHCLALSKEEVKKKLTNGENHVIRFKMPDDELISFTDIILGEISVNSKDLDDQILIKSDGFPTYHMAVVVDDHLMDITHILRGTDWVPSTPKHVLLYKAFGWKMPIIGHLPNLKEKGENKKLSKRYGSTFAVEFLEEGYLPEALINFLMFLGWNPGTEKEIYSLSEFIANFSLEKIHKTDLVSFDREKLLWFNGYYIRQISPEVLTDKLLAWAKRFNSDLEISVFDKDYIIKVVALIQERLKVLKEFKELSLYFFKDPTVDKDLLIKQTSNETRTKEILADFIGLLDGVSDANWTKDYLDKICHELLTQKGYKPKEAFMTLRVAVTGVTTTPPIFDTIAVLGKDATLKRLNSVLR